MHRKDYKRKRLEDQKATAHVFEDFLSTFQDSPSIPNKTFVRSGVLYAEKSVESSAEIYNPKPIIKPTNISTIKNAIEYAKILQDSKLDLKSKKTDKPLSNLESLKEELKIKHENRTEEKIKPIDAVVLSNQVYSDGADPNSTNVFISSLSTKVTENDLMLLFGQYGPLASVKIMWPRADDKSRILNCGFVAFMARKDAERALNALKSRTDFRIGWGKTVEIPQFPVYVPNSLLKLHLPPPKSGLPFNAQPVGKNVHAPKNEEELEKLISKSQVKVIIPFDKKILTLIHRIVEYVIREGPQFEAVVMNKEINNPEYTFLFENTSAAHIYYRWKLFSILKGDSQRTWKSEPFRMFKGGSTWVPPIALKYSDGMPDSLFEDPKDKFLSEVQYKKFLDILRKLTLERSKIADGLIFCMKHLKAIDDCVDLLIDSMRNSSSKDPRKKVARLYLLTDILANCMIKGVKLKICNERKYDLLEIFNGLHTVLINLNKSDADQFKTRVLKVTNIWHVSGYLPLTLIVKLENIFLQNTPREVEDDNSSLDEPLDGASLLKRMENMDTDKNANCVTKPDQQIKGKSDKNPNGKFQFESFVPSKWDTVDPEEVEAQAMSTEKMFLLDLERNHSEKENDQPKRDDRESRRKKSKKDKRKR